MGDQKVIDIRDKKARAKFASHLLQDVEALERMLTEGLFEEGVIRIGAEQEFCLVDGEIHPSQKAIEILGSLKDSHFTTELALYNLEINLDPERFTGDCFRTIQKQLEDLLRKAGNAARGYGAEILLAGILPTIGKQHLQKRYMTPSPRYDALNETMRQFRNDDFSLQLSGVDELTVTHDSVLFEACNTSFQLHLQVEPDDFISSYNWAQAISGPVLGICGNSPLLMGRELWRETRIGLFQQSLDTRRSTHAIKEEEPRVAFGSTWASGTVADIFKENIALHKIALSKAIATDSLAELDQGNVPKLEALNLHNGTVYRWNRPCYGVGQGLPHLRIENRYLPAGPTVADQMANFALWAGLMAGRPAEYDHMPDRIAFREAKANFIKASRFGKESMLFWNNKWYPVERLLLDELLPIARQGLERMQVDASDAERLLGIIENRARSRTGARWQLDNYRALRKSTKRHDALIQLTDSMIRHQQAGKPVHQWPDIVPSASRSAKLVDHIMSTVLFTVHQNDLTLLAVTLMRWRQIHHMPVVDDMGHLVGLLTWSHLELYDAHSHATEEVHDIMITEVLVTSPEASITEAKALMEKHAIGCLPVCSDGELVGIISRTDMEKFNR